MIWFPELFYRFEEYESRNANTSASVCDVSSVVLEEGVNGYVLLIVIWIEIFIITFLALSYL